MILLSTQSLLLFTFIFYLLYKYISRNNDYWKRRGVPYIKPKFFFGNYYDILMFKKTIGIKLKEMYDEIAGPFFGMWVFSTPCFIVKSPELIKNILIKDFKHFNDRTIASDEKADLMASYVLFIMRNPEWKTMRTKLTPAFTSGKMKSFLPIISKAGDDLVAYLKKSSAEQGNLEAKEICAKYSTDVITSCAFGVEANSFKDEDAQWRNIGRDMFAFSVSNGFRGASYFFLPQLVTTFKLGLIPNHITTFLREVFWQTITKRELDSTSRNDLIDIIIKLRKEGDFDGIKFEGDKVVAQAVQFFLAGFETTSSTIAYTLYELCIHKDIQKKATAEIKSEIEKHGGITYEAIGEMKYLHKCISEVLRKYPVLPFLDRRCVSDYQIPGTDVVLEKGTAVYIPMVGLHYDPEFYPNPDVFDPERFTEENINSRPNCAYIPFGSGPHNCLGERFGLLGTKLALIHVLTNFEVERCDQTPVPIDFEPKSFILASKVGLPMRFVDTTTTKQNEET